MISIKKYLDGVESEEGQGAAESEDPVLSAALDAYRSTLREMGNSGAAVCPVLGADFQQSLERLGKGLSGDLDAVAATESGVRST